MRYFKKIAALAAIGAMIFSCVGCSKEVEITPFIQMMRDIQTNLAEAESSKGVMVLDTVTRNGDIKNNVSIRLDSTRFEDDPVLYDITMTILDNDGNTDVTELYIVGDGEDKKLLHSRTNGSEWTKESVLDLIYKYSYGKYDISNAFNYLIGYAGELEEAGQEEINGVMCTKYVGVIPKNSVSKVLEGTGVLQFLGFSTLANKYYKKVVDSPVTFWFDIENLLPVRVEADLTESVSSVLNLVMKDSAANGLEGIKNLFSNDRIGADKFIYTIEFEGFNNYEKYEVPAEAAAGRLIES